MSTTSLSIVSPVYQSEGSIQALVEEIARAVAPLAVSYEILLIDDGSTDDSWKRISECCERDPRVKGMRLSRNFGQHYAITAGLEAARGERIVVIDCDLQEDPAVISEMMRRADEGYDVVFTAKSASRHSWTRRLASRFFSVVFNWLSGGRRLAVSSSTGTFSLITRKVRDAFLSVKDYHRHYLMVLRWVGFRSTVIQVSHRKRVHGRSSYTWTRLIRHALDGIVSQSDRLLYLTVKVGFSFVALALLSTAYLVVAYFTHGFRAGWTSIFVLILLSTGTILVCIGIVGIYIAKIFEQTKERPLYLVDRTLNF